ncbi:response regulator transcription factor [Sphingomonas pruni]|uniref:response regulator transcription factor n=1 Tax=Sphingomonas pruni TaxID=40683 RepID=UPI0008302077|nr:LuxR C-terminal-related transcriptional regulator [Sphingomonas pruni]
MLFREMIDASATAAVITNPRLTDNPIVACNDAFLSLTGYSRAEILGRNCRFLRGSDTDPDGSEVLRQGIREGRPTLAEVLNYRRDGSSFRNSVMVAPIFDLTGKIEYFLGSQTEIPEGFPLSTGNRQIAAAQQVSSLSGRQREILQLMASGKRNKEIAHRLGLSERTVKMHRAALLKALKVDSSADAIRMAVEAGF